MARGACETKKIYGKRKNPIELVSLRGLERVQNPAHICRHKQLYKQEACQNIGRAGMEGALGSTFYLGPMSTSA